LNSKTQRLGLTHIPSPVASGSIAKSKTGKREKLGKLRIHQLCGNLTSLLGATALISMGLNPTGSKFRLKTRGYSGQFQPPFARCFLCNKVGTLLPEGQL
jgi:hypothetical protein